MRRFILVGIGVLMLCGCGDSATDRTNNLTKVIKKQDNKWQIVADYDVYAENKSIALRRAVELLEAQQKQAQEEQDRAEIKESEKKRQ